MYTENQHHERIEKQEKATNAYHEMQKQLNEHTTNTNIQRSLYSF